MKVSIPKSNILRIFGPAVINVVKGKACILGKMLVSGDKIVVHKMRSYAILATEDLEIEVNLGPGAAVQEPNVDEEPITEWINVGQDIIGREKKIVVLGPVDSGKSSITILLSNIALNNGLKNIAVIDSDIGQADIGPPGFISLSFMSKQVIWMRELEPSVMRFIGDIRPQYHVDRIIWEINRLIEYSIKKGVDMIVIDTDGWIQDSHAINYKFKLIESIWPDEVVVMGEEYGRIFRRLEAFGVKVRVLKTPPVVKTRNRDERRWLRSEQYRRFLEDASIKKYHLNEVVIVGNPLFEGDEVDVSSVESIAGTKIYYASLLPDTLNIVIHPGTRVTTVDKIKEAFGVQKIRFYTLGFEKGIYVSVSKRDITEYPGVIESIDYNEKTISVKTMFSEKPFVIKFSRIRITKDYTEQLID